jgi:hypothetical protein
MMVTSRWIFVRLWMTLGLLGLLERKLGLLQEKLLALSAHLASRTLLGYKETVPKPLEHGRVLFFVLMRDKCIFLSVKTSGRRRRDFWLSSVKCCRFTASARKETFGTDQGVVSPYRSDVLHVCKLSYWITHDH